MASVDDNRIKIEHKGRLHRRLGVPLDKDIPLSKLKAAAHSKDASLRAEAQFALNARHFRHTH